MVKLKFLICRVADLDAQQKLNKIGFTNVKVYPGGIMEWNKKYKK